MRKYWFAYLAKAVVIFPGGFGTLDEFMEILTLVQTQKIKKRMPIVLFGKDYWNQVLHLAPLVEFGTINPEDLDLSCRPSHRRAFDYVGRARAGAQGPHSEHDVSAPRVPRSRVE
jgi:predicted Rossmann-fold nucleotide-binding protein